MKLKSKKVIRQFSTVFFPALFFGGFLLTILQLNWNSLDYKAIDYFYRKLIKNGDGPKVNNRIAYLTISDKTYQSFNENFLNRHRVAEASSILGNIGVQAIMFDIVFSRKTNQAADSVMQSALQSVGCAYLPVGVSLEAEQGAFRGNDSSGFLKMMLESYKKRPREIGAGKPYSARWGIMQEDVFQDATAGTGFISVQADDDGVLRFVPLVISLNKQLIPQVSFKIFLDYVQVPFEDIIIEWGKSITIPAIPGSYVDKEIVIPIDTRGCTFIPFPQTWESISSMMEMQNLISYAGQEQYSNSLANFFESKFVFVGDIAVGLSDVGQTTLEKDVPLLVVHAALMNGLLERTFYSHWSNWSVTCIFIGLGCALFAAIILRRNLLFYLLGICIPICGFFFTYYQLKQFHLFPFGTLIIAYVLLYIFMLIGIQYFIGKDQTFIKAAFAKYVAPAVVEQLIDNPGQLHLGGEGKHLSVLFSDIVGFTTISENLDPATLVSVLKKYLTEMTSIVLKNNGTIDKYLGDGILAEFGAPIAMNDHADAAVKTALAMHRALPALNEAWAEQGLPALDCRIGINTGYVIVGNLGSEQVFDYTILGDTANLASRLEGANKIYDTRLMISEFTLAELTPGLFRTRQLDLIKVKGKNKAVKIFQVVGYMDEKIPDSLLNYYRLYESGLEAYCSREFDDALQAFQQCLALKEFDYAAMRMIERITELDRKNLPSDWDCSFSATIK